MPKIPILPNAYEGPPNIDRRRIPEAEKPAFLHINTLLAELGLYERQLLLAVYLHEYCVAALPEITDFATLEHSAWTTGGWQLMACRDGAMTIYHFGCAVEGLTRSLTYCPSLNTQVDRRALKAGGNLFNAAFPKRRVIRDVVAHVADFSMTLKRKEAHSVKGKFDKKWFRSDDPNGVTWLRGNMSDDTYAVTYMGEAFTFDLTHESVGKMRFAKNQIYSAFSAATIANPGQ